TCVNTATGAVVAHNASGPSVSVDVASTTDNIVCTITNGLDRPPEGGGGGGHTPPPTPGVEAPQLSVVKTLPGQAPLGSIIPVTIRVTNHGRTAAHGVQVAETRPAGLQIVHVAGGTLLHTGTAVWFVGTLAPGHSRTVHATARVVAVGLHRDTAIATAGNADPALADAAVRAATHAPVPPVAPGVAPPPLVTG
ncbi:MAG: DUF11 domain-containing protein, partial [Conexibacteraceae bacterium]|nr:DUF11 domain-containing protein [Conexibacteraceae bacterium]